MNFKKHFIKVSSILLILGASIGISTNLKNVKADANIGNQMVMSVDWYQHSAEAKALYLQGYHLARHNLNHSLKQKTNKPRAIILDLDETVLDNSPYQGYNALHNTTFPTYWNTWVNMAKAKTVPGARSFLNYANKKKVHIYYVSDRRSDQLQATIKNLKRDKLPQSNKRHVLLKKKTDTSKEGRRLMIAKYHKVIMLFGDALTDFTDPISKTTNGRYQAVKKNARLFGTKYIVLPNPMYGGWESAMYGNNYKLTNQQKSNARISHITSFNPRTHQIVKGK